MTATRTFAPAHHAMELWCVCRPPRMPPGGEVP
jgi:hypothetical protein